MQLKDMIYCRKSVRSYTGEPVGEEMLAKIREFAASAKPLFPGIQTRCEIVSRDQVKTIMPWATPQLIAVFSQKKEGYLENAGFVFQQVEMYLQGIGLGACWLGLGKFRKSEIPQAEGMEFVIFIAFGSPDEPQFRNSAAEFRRKALSEITDREDPRLECARLAPSSTNSQPWYFTHEENVIHAYCCEAGFLRHKFLGNMNRIDMGIALAHIYLENIDTFRFFETKPKNSPKGYRYTGSFSLG